MNFLLATFPDTTTVIKAVRFSCQQQLVKLMLWAVLALTATALFVLSVFWWPTHNHYYHTEEAITAAYKSTVQRQSLAATAQAVHNAQQQLDHIEKKLSEKRDQATLVASLTNLAKRHNVTIIDQRYTQQQSQNDSSLPYIKISQELLLEGGYPQLRKFIGELTQLPALNIIRSVDMEKTGKNTLVKTWLKIETLSSTPVSREGVR